MADKDIIETAQELFKKDKAHWGEIYDKAREDLRFLSDDEHAQWDDADYTARVSSGRPTLTIDQLGQFVHQVANDIRANTPTINVIPGGKQSSVEVADVYKGLIRNIEYASGADNAYDMASLYSIKCSIGFIRIDHGFADDETFDQDLRIERVCNPLSIYIDSDVMEVDGRDAKHAFVLESMTTKEYKAKYNKDNAVSFDAEDKDTKKSDEDTVLVAEFFQIKETEKQIAIDAEGNVFDYTGGPAAKVRKVKDRTVMRYILSGDDVLEQGKFPGRHIPIVPVFGEESFIDGKRQLHSLIRKSKQAQQMFNYWKSLETELLMKQPKAQFLVAEGQIEDYAEDYKNPGKSIALRYKQRDSDGSPAPMPQIIPPPNIPMGIVNAAREAVDDIKATMGIYNASLGMRSNEQSGVAIAQRKVEGDVATYHFSDNLTKSIAQVGRVLVCAIPEIYDSARVLRIIGKEDEPEEIGVNGAVVPDQEMMIDLRQGKYDVKVVTGASYTTQRQEAAEFFTQIVTRQPELMNVMGDLLFKNMDFAGAQSMAERMKKVIDPKFLPEQERQEMEIQDPEKMQMAQIIQQGQGAIQEMQSEIVSLQNQLKDKQADNLIKAQSSASDSEIEKAKLELQVAELRLEEQKAAVEAQIKMQELDIKRAELRMKEAEAIISAQNNQFQAQQAAAYQAQGGFVTE